MIKAFLLFLFAVFSFFPYAADAAQKVVPAHGAAMHGDMKYKKNFKNFSKKY